MPIRSSKAEWQGNLKDGQGVVELGSGAFKGAYSFKSRFEDGAGTNPEELIAAAHAGCYSMALSSALTKAGNPPQRIETKAKVDLRKEEAGFRIAAIHLTTKAAVPKIDNAKFQEI